MKIKAYILVTAKTASELSLAVKNAIDTGWQPFESPIYHDYGDGKSFFAQAVVQYE